MLSAVMVGCGAMSRGWLQALNATPFLAQNVRMTGFVDLDEATAKQRATEFGTLAGVDGGSLRVTIDPGLVHLFSPTAILR